MSFFKSQMWKVLEWKDESKNTLVHRFDMQGQEIMSGSQLTVRESQVAVFVNQGKIADVFGPGQHKLTTKNLPILSAVGSIWYQGESRFKAELYFVNTKQFVDCKWGTSNPVTMRDNDFGVIRIRAYGNYAFRVSDAGLFLREVFGSNGSYKVEDIQNNLKTMLVSQMSDTIAESKISALDMACNYDEFGEMVRNHAQSKFGSMGLEITNFTIANISFPEAVEKAIDERSTLGVLKGTMEDYSKKKMADAIGDAANNEGSVGGTIGTGIGIAMAMQMNNATKPADKPVEQSKPKTKFCSECGAEISATAKFCHECGAKQSVANVCPSCGAKLSPTAKFCPECGKKIK